MKNEDIYNNRILEKVYVARMYVRECIYSNVLPIFWLFVFKIVYLLFSDFLKEYEVKK